MPLLFVLLLVGGGSARPTEYKLALTALSNRESDMDLELSSRAQHQGNLHQIPRSSSDRYQGQRTSMGSVVRSVVQLPTRRNSSDQSQAQQRRFPSRVATQVRHQVDDNVTQNTSAELALSGRLPYTLVISTYARDEALLANLPLFAECTDATEIVVVWHDPHRPIPDKVRALETDHVTVRFSVKTSDKLSNRFLPLDFENEAIFSLDDDEWFSCDAIATARGIWEQDHELLVGFAARNLVWGEIPSDIWNASCNYGPFNTVFATKGAFLSSSYYTRFQSRRWNVIREQVDSSITGEDILMSAVHFATVGSGKVRAIAMSSRDPYGRYAKNIDSGTNSLGERSSESRPALLKAVQDELAEEYTDDEESIDGLSVLRLKWAATTDGWEAMLVKSDDPADKLGADMCPSGLLQGAKVVFSLKDAQ